MGKPVVVIIDCFTDEPAGLGVPPYLGIYPRYLYGACRLAGADVFYLTIDDLRSLRLRKKRVNDYNIRKRIKNITRPKIETEKILSRATIICVISGIYTPGKYLSAVPGTYSEAARYLDTYNAVKIAGGPPVLLPDRVQGYDFVAEKDIAYFTYIFLREGEIVQEFPSYSFINRFSIAGAELLPSHPSYPYTVCDIETYRGCTRFNCGGCSFCVEPVIYGAPIYREQRDIIAEMLALYRVGGRYFRLGRQSCFYSYKALETDSDVYMPQPQEIRKLLSGIAFNLPELAVLHIDNVNPELLYRFPKESERITKYIVEMCSPGNVAAFGLESADPRVIKRNNLNTTPEHTLFAVELINRYGRKRGDNGLPIFLPGINILFGLPGESEETYRINYDFLKEILDKKLLLRRINIRRVVKYPGTALSEIKADKKILHLVFLYREKIRKDIDQEMLKRLVPQGTIIKNLVCEISKGNITYCRQPGSYPLVCVVNENLPEKKMIDIVVSGYRQRSVTGVPYPFDINISSLSVISSIPGIGKRLAAKIIRHRPFNDISELKEIVESKQAAEFLFKYLYRGTGCSVGGSGEG